MWPPAIAEQLAGAIRALDDAIGEHDEQVARSQLQRAAPDLDLDVAIAERVAARGDDAGAPTRPIDPLRTSAVGQR